VVTTDTLVAGVHFDDKTPVDMLGYKSVAVSLSDLAAMGATPAWLTLAITLPEAEKAWLTLFSAGLDTCCKEFDLALVGGNISHGPLTISTQVIGKVREGQYITRAGAQVGDDIYVTGKIGEAGLGLLLQQATIPWPQALAHDKPYLLSRLHKPTPRISVGLALLPFATACIDVSDGLAADLMHTITASGVGARISFDRMPLYTSYTQVMELAGGWQHAITAGEDYELCFTCAADQRTQVMEISRQTAVTITRIGSIEAAPGLRCEFNDKEMSLDRYGYRHFE
jgi:thiamine-monophosphate kinase